MANEEPLATQALLQINDLYQQIEGLKQECSGLLKLNIKAAGAVKNLNAIVGSLNARVIKMEGGGGSGEENCKEDGPAEEKLHGP